MYPHYRIEDVLGSFSGHGKMFYNPFHFSLTKQQKLDSFRNEWAYRRMEEIEITNMC